MRGKNTVTYEIEHNIPDRWGHKYPPKDECHITVFKTASSNGERTVEYHENVFFPEVGAVDGELDEAAGVLCDAFSGHFARVVKDFNSRHELLKWLMMDGGITPKSQPLDVLVNKVVKGLFRDLFEEWSLMAPMNETTGHPYPPSRQLLAQWLVQAWKRVPESLIKKAWDVAGYRSIENLEKEAVSDAIVDYSKQDLGSIVEELGGEDAMMAWIDDANEREDFSDDSDSDSDGWDWSLRGRDNFKSASAGLSSDDSDDDF